ncbi:sensor histidine kinase [Clostridium sp. Ade.TY]|uniref:sensor histidine kinase n=1 Tax=Clostridium sp. Ade.TY TaxID=1391647 RepID=UPI0003F5F92D|nr:sensor histidine kinase [Clostridium sp. Ade.TY]
MSFLSYLKDKSIFLIINLGLFILMAILMGFLKFGSGIIFIVFCIWFMPLVTYIIFQFLIERRFYTEITEISEGLDKKYLLAEIISKPEFLEGQIVYEALKEANKDMHEHINIYKNMQNEYRDYIEMWVHEIKTPIASTNLIIENNKNEITKNISGELKKIDDMIEQVLYYSRSDEANKDYIVKQFPLKKAVMNCIKKNSRDFITKKIKLNIGEIDINIFSDIKWIEFIINQILGNSLKYTSNGGEISIRCDKDKNKVALSIEDNGVGINESELNKVFIKGFTGENGRIFGKSTGIGLYLCKKLCDKLGLGIGLESNKGKGTKVIIIFPIGNTNI